MSRADVRREADRLSGLPLAEARQEFSRSVDRAFGLNAPATLAEFADALDFNARLASELRERYSRRATPSIWAAPNGYGDQPAEL